MCSNLHQTAANDAKCCADTPKIRTLLRVPGIEPGPIAWEAMILPLDHTRFRLFQKDILAGLQFSNAKLFETCANRLQTHRTLLQHMQECAMSCLPSILPNKNCSIPNFLPAAAPKTAPAAAFPAPKFIGSLPAHPHLDSHVHHLPSARPVVLLTILRPPRPDKKQRAGGLQRNMAVKYAAMATSLRGAKAPMTTSGSCPK